MNYNHNRTTLCRRWMKYLCILLYEFHVSIQNCWCCIENIQTVISIFFIGFQLSFPFRIFLMDLFCLKFHLETAFQEFPLKLSCSQYIRVVKKNCMVVWNCCLKFEHNYYYRIFINACSLWYWITMVTFTWHTMSKNVLLFIIWSLFFQIFRQHVWSFSGDFI
jgi:hypothetical protein